MAGVRQSKSKLDLASLHFNVKNKVVVKSSEFSVDMIEKAVELADNAVSRNLNAGDIAEYIKTNFDILYPGFWHCIVGTKFSSVHTHERGHFLYFYIKDLAVLLFK